MVSVPPVSSACHNSQRACCDQPPRSSSSRWKAVSAASAGRSRRSAARRMARSALSGASATWAQKPSSPAISGVRSCVAHSRQAAKAPWPGRGDQSACPRSKWPAAQSPMLRAMIAGQSVPVALAASAATVGSASGAGAVSRIAAFSAARSCGFAGAGQAVSAAERSSSVISPAASFSASAARGWVSLAPATRASRAEACARSSPAWPRKGFTATVASSGKAGGMARAAASAACRISVAREAVIRSCLRNIGILPVQALRDVRKPPIMRSRSAFR